MVDAVFTRIAGNENRFRWTFTCPWCWVAGTADSLVVLGLRKEEHWCCVACVNPRCEKPVLLKLKAKLAEGKALEMVPPPRPVYAGDGVPANIARDFQEAMQAAATELYLAAALVARRALQSAVRDCGSTHGTLQEEIESLETDQLPASVKVRAQEIRLLGNHAASSEPVRKAEAMDLIEYASIVLDHLYFMPERLRKSRDRQAAQQGQGLSGGSFLVPGASTEHPT